MIVWVNGAFGSGKTTLVEELRRRRPAALVYDFFLKVPPEVLARRIDARSVAPDDPERDEAARRWGKAQIAECVAAVDALPVDTVFLDGERPRDELAHEVLTRVGVSPGS